MAKTFLVAQGDILLQRISTSTDVKVDKEKIVPKHADGSVVLAEGEIHGHRHRFIPTADVLMFRDDAMAREFNIPANLYAGTVVVEKPSDLVHEEHDTIEMPPGTYIVRRQREMSGEEERRIAD